MPYAADISRANPACFFFLIDQSGSMTQALSGQPGQRKMGPGGRCHKRYSKRSVATLLSRLRDSRLFQYRSHYL